MIKRKLACFILIVSLLISCTVYVSAAEETEPADEPSSWAQWDIFMANVYQIGDVAMYSNYQGIVAKKQFMSAHSSLNKKFGVDDKLGLSDYDTVKRGDVINELYDIIILALKADENVQAIDYFAANGLISGGAQKNYRLNSACTVQEMIIFSERVYEYLIQKKDLASKGFFWKISDENNTVYLLGSIHLSDGSLYPLNKKMTDAFAECENLVVEANILNPDMAQIEYMNTLGFISDEKTIKDYISEETYTAFAGICDYFGIPSSVYDKMMPWYASLLMQQLAMSAQDNLDDAAETYAAMTQLGIDMYFLQTAGGRAILELESIKHQADVFASFSPELQETLLRSLVLPAVQEPAVTEEPADAEEYSLADMLATWRAGDDDGLLKYFQTEDVSDPLLQEYYDKLLTIRNKGMVEKIVEYINDDSEDYFTIAGAAHMIGEEGIVPALIALGYKVERIK